MAKASSRLAFALKTLHFGGEAFTRVNDYHYQIIKKNKIKIEKLIEKYIYCYTIFVNQKIIWDHMIFSNK